MQKRIKIYVLKDVFKKVINVMKRENKKYFITLF